LPSSHANEPGSNGTADVAVVGGGAAGLHVALEAAEAGGRVVVVSRKPLTETASFRAQGGLAAAIAPDDSPARHAEDTLNAGRGLCFPAAVEVLVEESPAAVEALMRRGVEFDLDAGGELALGLEGGHSARRIVHAGGAETGRALTSRLAELVAGHERIEVLEDASALALWSEGRRCHGVLTDRGPIGALATVLATGGGAALWERSTNPRGAIGAGAILAHGAGAELADLELCQFHPTALALPGRRLDGWLITEAVRGEGALLLDADGRRFTDELAPRDQVTAAIIDRMAADGTAAVALDLRPVPLERFPTITRTLGSLGIDPKLDPVPVAPAAHYLIGGVRTDLDGRTTLPGLLAVGEAACTGLHGANRLASTSLLEGLVWGYRAAQHIQPRLQDQARPNPAMNSAFEQIDMLVPNSLQSPHKMDTVKRLMWEHVGLMRMTSGMEYALRELRHLQAEVEALYQHSYLTDELVGLRNVVQVALLITRAALENKNNLGCHYRLPEVKENILSNYLWIRQNDVATW
jgi:L-aspartate oxidase